MKIIQKLVMPALLTFALLGGLTMLSSTSTWAANCAPGSQPKDCILDGSSVHTGAGSTSLKDQIKTVVDILLFVLGAIAVIVIVIGGIRYAVSGGDSSAVTGAKNSILYAVIGLVVALLAYAIVHFVVDTFVAVDHAVQIIVA